MRGVVAVAHPDDCVIFAWPFMEAHPEFTWDIVYLTYFDKDDRAKELKAYWDKRNVPTQFLGFKDDYEDQLTQRLNFWYGIDAQASLISAIKGSALILTHNADGDYGHIHHKFVHNSIEHIDTPKVYFASTFNYNTKCTVTTPVDTTELPLHREVIEGFQDRNTGLYIITEQARLLLENNENFNP
jgi:LmbE family N-acetylglucosaminyl deacetylase